MPSQTIAAPEAPSGLRNFLAVVQRRRLILLAAALAAGIAGYAIASRGEAEYESSTVLLVGSLSSNSDTLQAAAQLATTYAQLATTRPVLEASARRAGLPAPRSRVTANASTVTRLLTVRVRDVDPLVAARVADGEGAELIAVAERRRGLRPGAGRIRVVDPAAVNHSPTGPKPAAIAALAALVGLLGALAIVLLLDHSAETVTNPNDLEAVTGVPCVGALSRAALRGARAEMPLVVAQPRSRGADEYRLLAAKLAATGRRSLLVVSIDGDSAVAAHNLAAAMAAGGSRVALIDTSAQSSADAPTGYGPNAEPDEDDVATGDTAHELAISGAGLPARVNGHGRRWDAPPIEILDAADLAETPAGPDGARDAVEQVQADADMVLLYSAPLTRSPDALAWARAAQGTVLLAQRDRTTARDVRAALETLRLVNARLLATVLADPPPLLRR